MNLSSEEILLSSWTTELQMLKRVKLRCCRLPQSSFLETEMKISLQLLVNRANFEYIFT